MAIWNPRRAVMLFTVAASALIFATGKVEAQCQRNGQTGTQTSTTGTSSTTATNTATARRQVGLLRQAPTGKPEPGKAYWMAFSNKGRLVKRGDHVSVVIGRFHADGLVVE